MRETVHIKSISQMHDFFDLPRPLHPLISVYSEKDMKMKITPDMVFGTDLYQISLKIGLDCDMGYGMSSYDFEEGTMIFMAPGQTFYADQVKVKSVPKGWNVVFHPDFIKKTDLEKTINQFTFFNYEINEALHLSEKEIDTVTNIAGKIEDECSLNMDRHSQKLTRANLEMLLNYCVRYYDRQFYTRININTDHITRFITLLEDYYGSDMLLDMGIPTVQYCGREMGLSPYYLSDLLKRETGKNALEHIHLFIVEKAKALMADTDLTITQVAYDLGFEYPQHFSKLFKSKTGMSPRDFRVS